MRDSFEINGVKVGHNCPTYFIADIAANHDGSLERAKSLVKLAHEAGADAVKFQHHNVKKYVSDVGFKSLGGKFSHQQAWQKSIFEVYKDAEVPTDWTIPLKEYCQELGVTFFSTPYDLEMVDHLAEHVPAFKIGSGDVSWDAMLEKVAKTNKPVLLATGASTIGEVHHAVEVLSKHTDKAVLMQCNTNYTAEKENFKYINLNVLKTYATMFPDLVLGLSDHTHGDITVLGAVALGARVVEKHFTDDTSRKGPDHPFSMDPASWRQMVDNTRALELAMGHPTKQVEENEKETVVLQRRAIRVIKPLRVGAVITRDMVEFQRPCPQGAYIPNQINEVLGKRVRTNINKGEHLNKVKIEW